MGQFILVSIGVFLITILLLVIILLVAKKYLSPSGNVDITINGDKTLTVAQGNSLMSTLNENGIYLPSACGGKASCGQCKIQVIEGGGEISGFRTSSFHPPTGQGPLASRLPVQGQRRL
jgi:Na+-transporting NADH:ubiquinone oxidoreductase subunit F